MAYLGYAPISTSVYFMVGDQLSTALDILNRLYYVLNGLLEYCDMVYFSIWHIQNPHMMVKYEHNYQTSIQNKYIK